jgi:hypothetical protein
MEAGRCRCCWSPRTPSSVTAISWLITPSRQKNLSRTYTIACSRQTPRRMKTASNRVQGLGRNGSVEWSSKPPCVDGTHHQFSLLPPTEPYCNLLTHQAFLRYSFSHICAGDYASKSPVGRSNVAVRPLEIAPTHPLNLSASFSCCSQIPNCCITDLVSPVSEFLSDCFPVCLLDLLG